MNLKINIKIDYVLRFFMIILFCSFTILTTYSWGRYVMLLCIVVIAFLDLKQSSWNYKVRLNGYVITVALFCIYIFMSSLWAIDSSASIEKGKTLLEMTFMVFVLYNCYCKREDAVSEILFIIKWSGYVIVIYSILFYGIEQLALLAMAEERMQTSYANVNTIGMLAAVSVIIQLDEIISDKKMKLAFLFCVPAILLIALTQSRKALIMLITGFILVLFLHNLQNKDVIKKILRIILFIVIGIFLLSLLLSLPIFEGMMKRMEQMANGLFGFGKMDNSTRLRMEMMNIGWTQFLKTPLFGMGMGNPYLLVQQAIGEKGYLHNNFIELFAGGGIIGFTIYYSMYAYLFSRFWKYRKCKNKEYIVCLVIMSLLFAMDFGMVSYYNKMRYVYLLLYYLEVERLAQQYNKKINLENTNV